MQTPDNFDVAVFASECIGQSLREPFLDFSDTF